MKYDSIADIFAANRAVRERLFDMLADVSETESEVTPAGSWSVKQIAEHLAMVDDGVSRICARLLRDAKEAGLVRQGPLEITPRFWQKAAELSERKVVAPDQVQPSGAVCLSDSITMLKSNEARFESMRDDLDSLDLSSGTFPHPFFGPLNAIEWLVLIGWHEQRHVEQAARLLEAIRQKKPRLEGG